MWMNTLGFSLFGTMAHGKPDYQTLKPATECGRLPIRSRTANSPSTGCPQCSSRTPTTRRISPSISRCGDGAAEKQVEHDKFCRTFCVGTVRPGFDECGRGGRGAEIRLSTPRTAFTAKPATSKIRPRTLTGRHQRVAADRTIRTCERRMARFRHVPATVRRVYRGRMFCAFNLLCGCTANGSLSPLIWSDFP